MTSNEMSLIPPVPADLLGSPMMRALLEELLSKLTALADEGRSDSIDLRGLPLPPGALEALRNWLGQGEIQATVNALGSTTIHETALGGVWWIRYAKVQGTPIGDTLEIAHCPALLLADRDDAREAAKELRRRLDRLTDSSTVLPPASANPG